MQMCTRDYSGYEIVLSGFFGSVGVWPHHPGHAGHGGKTREVMELLEIGTSPSAIPTRCRAARRGAF